MECIYTVVLNFSKILVFKCFLVYIFYTMNLYDFSIHWIVMVFKNMFRIQIGKLDSWTNNHLNLVINVFLCSQRNVYFLFRYFILINHFKFKTTKITSINIPWKYSCPSIEFAEFNNYRLSMLSQAFYTNCLLSRDILEIARSCLTLIVFNRNSSEK
jgi:hypothetical protein